METVAVNLAKAAHDYMKIPISCVSIHTSSIFNVGMNCEKPRYYIFHMENYQSQSNFSYI